MSKLLDITSKVHATSMFVILDAPKKKG